MGGCLAGVLRNLYAIRIDYKPEYIRLDCPLLEYILLDHPSLERLQLCIVGCVCYGKVQAVGIHRQLRSLPDPVGLKGVLRLAGQLCRVLLFL